MKNYKLFIVLALLCTYPLRSFGQYDQEEYDAIEKNYQLQRAAMNDGMYDYVTTGSYKLEELYGPATVVDANKIEETIQEQERKAQQEQEEREKNANGQSAPAGIQFTVDKPEQANQIDYEKRRQKQLEKERQKQQKKAQDEARRQQWLEQRRAADRAAAQRALEQWQREVDRIEAEEYEKAQKEYVKNAAKVSYQTNEGRDFMYNYHIQGTEIHPSSYVASPGSHEPVTVTPQGGYTTSSIITMNGNEKVMAQTANWQYAADLERTKEIGRHVTACKDSIIVVPIGNGCGPAEGKFKQVAAKVGKYLDAAINMGYYNPAVLYNPSSVFKLVEEADRLDNVCSTVHDPGYVNALTTQDKNNAEDSLKMYGGRIMSFFTRHFGYDSWVDAAAAGAESKTLAVKNPEIKFDPNKQLLKKVRVCGTIKF